MVLKILSRAIQKIFRQWKLWLTVYLFITALALLTALPISVCFSDFAGTSSLVPSITSGNLTETPLYEFFLFHKEIISYSFTLLPLLLGLTVLFCLFFKGGFITVCLKKNCTLTAPEFMKISACKFPGLLLIAAVSVIVIIPALLLNIPFTALCRWIAGDSEPLIAFLFIIRLIIFMAVFIIIKTIFDFAQITAVYNKNIKTLSAVKNGCKIFFRYPSKILGLAFITITTAICITVAHSGISSLLKMETAIGVAASVIIQQIVLLIRIGIILVFTCSEAGLFSEYEVPLLKWWYDGRSQQGISE